MMSHMVGAFCQPSGGCRLTPSTRVQLGVVRGLLHLATDSYSARSASMGSMEAARMAG